MGIFLLHQIDDASTLVVALWNSTNQRSSEIKNHFKMMTITFSLIEDC